MTGQPSLFSLKYFIGKLLQEIYRHLQCSEVADHVGSVHKISIL
jgi:hypothetical protein